MFHSYLNTNQNNLVCLPSIVPVKIKKILTFNKQKFAFFISALVINYFLFHLCSFGILFISLCRIIISTNKSFALLQSPSCSTKFDGSYLIIFLYLIFSSEERDQRGREKSLRPAPEKENNKDSPPVNNFRQNFNLYL